MHVMAWVSLTYMESDLTQRARFNILESTFEENDGEDQDGHTLGGRNKALALRLGRFHYEPTFREPRVDALLNGLTNSFSCRYGSHHIDQLTEDERRERIKNLETFDTFNHTFQTLLGEESSWKFPMGPEVQPVDPGKPVPRMRKKKSTNRRDLRLGGLGLWPY